MCGEVGVAGATNLETRNHYLCHSQNANTQKPDVGMLLSRMQQIQTQKLIQCQLLAVLILLSRMEQIKKKKMVDTNVCHRHNRSKYSSHQHHCCRGCNRFQTHKSIFYVVLLPVVMLLSRVSVTSRKRS